MIEEKRKKRLLYFCWKSMLYRCNNEQHYAYHSYGGRGIKVSIEWYNFNSFYNDMGPSWKLGLQLDRVDNEKGYFLKNCQWATRSQQTRNRRTSIFLKNGKTISESARIIGITNSTLTKRIKKWGEEKALSQAKYLNKSH